jgi:hypothetical protein
LNTDLLENFQCSGHRQHCKEVKGPQPQHHKHSNSHAALINNLHGKPIMQASVWAILSRAAPVLATQRVSTINSSHTLVYKQLIHICMLPKHRRPTCGAQTTTSHKMTGKNNIRVVGSAQEPLPQHQNNCSSAMQHTSAHAACKIPLHPSNHQLEVAHIRTDAQMQGLLFQARFSSHQGLW